MSPLEQSISFFVYPAWVTLNFRKRRAAYEHLPPAGEVGRPAMSQFNLSGPVLAGGAEGGTGGRSDAHADTEAVLSAGAGVSMPRRFRRA